MFFALFVCEHDTTLESQNLWGSSRGGSRRIDYAFPMGSHPIRASACSIGRFVHGCKTFLPGSCLAEHANLFSLLCRCFPIRSTTSIMMRRERNAFKLVLHCWDLGAVIQSEVLSSDSSSSLEREALPIPEWHGGGAPIFSP